MRQINFTLIFSFGLLMVFFTLVNTAPTTVHVFPGVEYTMPLAALLLLLAAGLGAVSAWFFAPGPGCSTTLNSSARRTNTKHSRCGSRNWRPTSAATAPPLKPSWASSRTTVSATSAESDDNDQAEVTDASSAA